MRGFIWALLLCIPAVSHSKENPECDKYLLTNQQSGYFVPARWGHVTSNGKTFFHFAPNAKCVSKKVFVIKGDYLSIYAPYDDWLYMMYINGKTGEDFMGWVPEKNVKIEGKYKP